jgi:hypothetical protein
MVCNEGSIGMYPTNVFDPFWTFSYITQRCMAVLFANGSSIASGITYSCWMLNKARVRARDTDGMGFLSKDLDSLDGHISLGTNRNALMCLTSSTDGGTSILTHSKRILLL